MPWLSLRGRCATLPLVHYTNAYTTFTHKHITIHINIQTGVDKCIGCPCVGGAQRCHLFPTQMPIPLTHAHMQHNTTHAQYKQVCITALAAPAWEVRNAATQCLTSLIVRVLGFKNTGSCDGRKFITGACMCVYVCVCMHSVRCVLGFKNTGSCDGRKIITGVCMCVYVCVCVCVCA